MKISLLGNFAYPVNLEDFYLDALREITPNVVTEPDENVDLTIVVKWLRDPRHIHGKKVLIFPDHTSRYNSYFQAVQRFFDYVFLAHKEQIIDNRRTFHLPFAHSPKHHYPLNLPKDIDVLFIGTKHPSREWMLQIPKLTRYGNEWHDTRAVYGQEFLELYARAKIVLNNTYPADTCNMRFYEALAMRSFLLTDKWDDPFKPHVHFIPYSYWKDDLLSKIDHYLKNEEERREIAEAGYREVQSHTYKKRVERVLEICGF